MRRSIIFGLVLNLIINIILCISFVSAAPSFFDNPPLFFLDLNEEYNWTDRTGNFTTTTIGTAPTCTGDWCVFNDIGAIDTGAFSTNISDDFVMWCWGTNDDWTSANNAENLMGAQRGGASIIFSLSQHHKTQDTDRIRNFIENSNSDTYFVTNPLPSTNTAFFAAFKYKQNQNFTAWINTDRNTTSVANFPLETGITNITVGQALDAWYWDGNITQCAVVPDGYDTFNNTVVNYIINQNYTADYEDFYPYKTASLTLINLYNSTSINSFSVRITNATDTYDVVTTNGSVEWPINQTINIIYYNITGAEGVYYNRTYLNKNSSNGLQGQVWQSYLTLTAVDSNSNTINSFNCTNTYLDLKTTTGNITNTRVNAENITLDCAAGLYKNVSHSVTTTSLTSTSSQINFGNVSIDLIFRNEKDNSIFNETEVVVDLISQSLDYSVNYSSSNGSFTINNTLASYYNILVSSNISNTRGTYYYLPENTTDFELTLYLLETTDAKNIGFVVQDENGDRVESAEIRINKWFIFENNIIVGKYVTNYNGVSAIDLKDYSFYTYEIYYNNILKESASEFFIHAISGDTKTFTISISEDTIGNIIDFTKIDFNLTYNNQTQNVELDWNDRVSTIDGVCLKIYYDSNSTLINTQCYSGTSGSQTYLMTGTSFYRIQGYVNDSNVLKYAKTAWADLKNKIVSKEFLFIAFIWILVSFILWIFIDWRIALFMSLSLPLFLFTSTGLMPLPGYVVPFITITIIIVIATIYMGSKR